MKKRIRGANRRLREARTVARALKSRHHPILAHIIPVRRCNLSCSYCNEYDDYSKPVPTPEMLRRVDLLAALGTTVVTVSGGEPLLHPELDEIIRRVRERGMIVTAITNGYLLTPERIKRLNRAGLDTLQVSIDNVRPDEVSKKSLKVLDKKLQWLRDYAEFDVTINSVLGSGNAQDAMTVAKRAIELGFATTVGVIHDGSGRARPLTPAQQTILEEMLKLQRPVFSFARYDHFQRNLARGLPNDWQCHAGSRYLYICEDGLVHWCSQQRGYPGIPLERYTQEHLEREYDTVKPCAPYCTVSCVHQVSLLDDLRERPLETVGRLFSARPGESSELPRAVRFLVRCFLTSKRRRLFTGAALRLLGVKSPLTPRQEPSHFPGDKPAAGGRAN